MLLPSKLKLALQRVFARRQRRRQSPRRMKFGSVEAVCSDRLAERHQCRPRLVFDAPVAPSRQAATVCRRRCGRCREQHLSVREENLILSADADVVVLGILREQHGANAGDLQRLARVAAGSSRARAARRQQISSIGRRRQW